MSNTIAQKSKNQIQFSDLIQFDDSQAMMQLLSDLHDTMWEMKGQD